MARGTALIFSALAAAAAPAAALAQSRCDCTTVVDRCAATVVAREGSLDVTTDSRQCARVDYFVDGLPFVATVTDGKRTVEWNGSADATDIRIQSCQVCADSAGAAATASRRDSSAGSAEDAALVPLIRWNPEYPDVALTRGLEGHVTVGFDVDAEGTVEDATVTDSEPAGVFDAAALAAVRRWRYAPDEQRPSTHVVERIEFSLRDMIFDLRPSGAAMQSGAPAGLPRNQCIREDAVYNFGEMVEAGLINACSDPLLLFGCAEGTGRQSGRWVCSDSERAGQLLVRPGDARIGTTVQDGEDIERLNWLTYVDNYFVAHAPNSQYWWIACAQADSQCRDDAKMWIRSMDRKPASVDPRGRSSATVARSY
jgi:TonB family protein